MEDDPPEDDTVKLSSRTFVTCGGCNKEVNNATEACPYCGKTLKAEWNWTLMILYVVFFASAAFLAYFFG